MPSDPEPQAPFRSILFADGDARAGVDELKPPPYFADLHLDQVVASVVAGREAYRLEPFFSAPLRDVDAIAYRHEVTRDLQDETLSGHVSSFAHELRTMRSHLAQAGMLRHRYQKAAWFLGAVEVYCGAVRRLARDLDAVEVRSRGFIGFRAYLAGHVASAGFAALEAQTRGLKDDLAAVRYSVRITGSRVTVTRYEEEADYSADVLATFAKFAQGAVKDYRIDFPDPPDLNPVEGRILDMVGGGRAAADQPRRGRVPRRLRPASRRCARGHGRRPLIAARVGRTKGAGRSEPTFRGRVVKPTVVVF